MKLSVFLEEIYYFPKVRPNFFGLEDEDMTILIYYNSRL